MVKKQPTAPVSSKHKRHAPIVESVETLHRKNEAKLLVIKLPKSIAPDGQTQLTILPTDLKNRKNLIGRNASIYSPVSGLRYTGKIYKGVPHGYGVKTWKDGKRY